MAKTKEELNQLKIEYETLNAKLKELSEDEMKMVSGGSSTGQNSDEDKQNALKRAEEQLLAKKQEYDTSVMR